MVRMRTDRINHKENIIILKQEDLGIYFLLLCTHCTTIPHQRQIYVSGIFSSKLLQTRYGLSAVLPSSYTSSILANTKTSTSAQIDHFAIIIQKASYPFNIIIIGGQDCNLRTVVDCFQIILYTTRRVFKCDDFVLVIINSVLRPLM